MFITHSRKPDSRAVDVEIMSRLHVTLCVAGSVHSQDVLMAAICVNDSTGAEYIKEMQLADLLQHQVEIYASSMNIDRQIETLRSRTWLLSADYHHIVQVLISLEANQIHDHCQLQIVLASS